MSIMACPECGSMKTKVIDSRPNPDGNVVRRRRRCDACNHRSTTYEVQASMFTEALDRAQEVADARQALIQEYAATLPQPPAAVKLKLRPR